MSARETFGDALRRVATYSADEGTCGWLLTDAQFAAIEAAADEYRADGLRELAAELEWEACRRDPHGTSGPALRVAARIARERAEGGTS